MSYFKANMNQIRLPLGELAAFPHTIQLYLRGPTSKGREGTGGFPFPHFSFCAPKKIKPVGTHVSTAQTTNILF